MKTAPLSAALLPLCLILPAQRVSIGGPANGPAASVGSSILQQPLSPRFTSVQRAVSAGPAAGWPLVRTSPTPGVDYSAGSARPQPTTAYAPPLAGVVSTLAGSGTAGFANGSGTDARFNGPQGIAWDGHGNVYVADKNNHCIRRIVVATGVVSTLAGSGADGFADGAGKDARFASPAGVACDGRGNVYVADFGNSRIRRIVAATGVVSTLAGSGTEGFADGPGKVARFHSPISVACDGRSNVYVADMSNQRVRKIVAATGVVSTLAGSGTAGFANGKGAAASFNYPNSVACDSDGNLVVLDAFNNRLCRIVAATGMVSPLPGSSTLALHDPAGVALDGHGNVYVADFSSNSIRCFGLATGALSTLAGRGTDGFADGQGVAAGFNNPTGVACDGNGTVYVADLNNHRIRVIR